MEVRKQVSGGPEIEILKIEAPKREIVKMIRSPTIFLTVAKTDIGQPTVRHLKFLGKFVINAIR